MKAMKNETVTLARDALFWAIEQLAQDGNKGHGYFDTLRAALAEPGVNFDLDRMQQALAGKRITMPDGLSREQFRAWMDEHAALADPEPTHPGCSRCGCSTVEHCDEIGCGFLGSGNGEPLPPAGGERVERGSTHGFEQSPNTCRHDDKSGVWWREGDKARTGQERNACGRVFEDPVEPAGGEVEVFEPHGWAQTDGPAINAFTQEFDIAEEWAMAGYGTVELLNREHVDAEIDRLRGEHQAIATRLQAEVERLNRDRAVLYKLNGELWTERDALQSELTKAQERPAVDPIALRSVLQNLCGPMHHIRELQVCRGLPGNPIDQLQREFNEWVKSAPAAKDWHCNTCSKLNGSSYCDCEQE
jgi:hypothetical protein